MRPAGAPVEPDYSPDGLDRSLIRWMLTLTPAQRLQVLQDFVDAVEELREVREKS